MHELDLVRGEGSDEPAYALSPYPGVERSRQVST